MKSALGLRPAVSPSERDDRRPVLPRPAPQPLRLWMGLCFPRLPLEALGRDAGAATAPPLAVASDGSAHSSLLAVNERARAAGIRPGMGLGAACAHAPRLEVRVRDPALEEATLEKLAVWAGRFSAFVSPAPPAGLLLEVGGSLRLFGGVEMLRQGIESGLRGLGFEASIGTAPTAAAAWLLARAGFPEPVLDRSRLPGRLAEVPLACLDLPEPALRDLAAMGVRSFRDAYRLPRDAVSRRVGGALVDAMDRALGRRSEARARYTAPPDFSRRLDFPDEVEEMPPILAGLRRLLQELTSFLQARTLGVSGLELRLLPRFAPALRIPVSLISASRDPEHLLDLLEKRLEKVTLIRPVAAIGLDVLGFEVQGPRNADLYDVRAAAPRDSLHTLVERLQSRLGRGALWRLALVADHRPERAFSRVPPCDARAGPKRPPELRSVDHAPGTKPRPATTEAARIPRRPESVSRPLWLLEAPRRIEPGSGRRERLEISPHFERIESGWWDGEDVRRDYHVARGASGVRYWVYREHGTRDWFIHGVFG